MVILIAFAQTLLLPFAGLAMYWLWKRVTSNGRWVALLVTGGFLIRTVLGLLLFWASYLPLRFPAGTEDDNGFWFYAWDARTYFRSARVIAEAGPWAILTYPSQSAAVFFVKVLGSLIFFLGNAAPVGLLMNLFAYLGTCAALLSLFPRESRATTLAIGALSLSPSLILWSLQPLKDVVFLCLIAAFVATAFLWQNLWKPGPERVSRWRRAGAGAALVALLYGVAGIRWYFAFLLLFASVLFLALSSVRARAWKQGLASVFVFVGLTCAFFGGGGAYVPEALWEVVRPATSLGSVVKLPEYLREKIVGTREGFKNTAANTDIVSPDDQKGPSTAVTATEVAATQTSAEGTPSPSTPTSRKKTVPQIASGAVRSRESPPPSAPPPTASSELVPQDIASNPVPVAPEPAPPIEETTSIAAAETTLTSAEHVATGPAPAPAPPVTTPPMLAERNPPAANEPIPSEAVPAPVTESTPPIATEIARADPVASPPEVVRAPAPTKIPTRGTRARAPRQRATRSVETPAAAKLTTTASNDIEDVIPLNEAGNSARTAGPRLGQPAPPAVPAQETSPGTTPSSSAAEESSGAPPSPSPEPSGPNVAPSAVTDESAGAAQFRAAAPASQSAVSHAAQLLVGISAMLLPRFVGEALGLFRVGGSRVLWLFAEVDTLYFDAVLLIAGIALMRALRRGGWRNPTLALVVVTTAVIGGMLAYTITNFGTLFRHRGMVFIGLVMIPLLIAAESAGSRTTAVSGSAGDSPPSREKAKEGGEA